MKYSGLAKEMGVNQVVSQADDPLKRLSGGNRRSYVLFVPCQYSWEARWEFVR